MTSLATGPVLGRADHATLLRVATGALESYRRTRPRPLADEHIAEACARGGLTDAADVGFVHQVCTGCLRYAKLNAVALDAFFHLHSAESQRSAAALYEVFAYLLLLRSDELGPRMLASFVASQEPITMLYFLDFLLDEPTIREWVYDGWCELYDAAFVDSQFMAAIRAAAGSYGPPLIAALRARVENIEAERAAASAADDPTARSPRRSATTQPRPFALTQPKARPLPPLVEIPVAFTAAPAPPTTYHPDLTTLNAVETAKARSRAATARRHAAAKPFTFTKTHAEEKAEADAAAAAAAEAAAAAAAEHPRFANPVPDFGVVDVPVRLNAAAILREEALYLKAVEEEKARLEAFETGQRDAAEYHRWQREGEAAAAAEAKARRRAQKAEARRARHAAATARSRAARKKAAVVRDVMADKDAAARRKAKAEARRAKENAAKVAAATETRESAAAAKARIVAEKQATAAAMQAEAAAARKAKEADDAAAAAERARMIRQIRALERVPQHRYKLKRDPTQANSSFISAMSDVELRERLAAAKRTRDAEVAAKRESIIAAKQAKADEYKARMARLAALRASKHSRAAQARSAKAAAAARARDAAATRNDADAVRLASKLVAKDRAKARERGQRAADERRIRARNRFLKGDKDALEQTHYAELEAAKARSARARQEAAKADALVADETEAFASHARQVARTHRSIAKTRELSAADRDFEASKAHASAVKTRRKAAAKRKVAAARTQRKRSAKKLAARKPYNIHIQARLKRDRATSQPLPAVHNAAPELRLLAASPEP